METVTITSPIKREDVKQLNGQAEKITAEVLQIAKEVMQAVGEDRFEVVFSAIVRKLYG